MRLVRVHEDNPSADSAQREYPLSAVAAAPEPTTGSFVSVVRVPKFGHHVPNESVDIDRGCIRPPSALSVCESSGGKVG